MHISPHANGNGAVWRDLTTKAEAERTDPCKHLDDKALFTGTLRLYTAILREVNETLQPEQRIPRAEEAKAKSLR